MTLEKPLTKKQRQWLKLFDALDQRLTMPIDAFRSLGTVTETKDGPLIYIDRGSPVLGVAHLDTVCKGKLPKPRWINGDSGFPVVNSIALDDRLGAWVLLDLLPSLGLKFDVLLCDGEERGHSTAAHFQPTRQYNWGFEFDRQGTDTVLYDYEDSEEWQSQLEFYGFDIGMGSFSDISSLTQHGFCCANFGVGYHKQHTPDCYADLCDTHYMAGLFVDFFKENMNHLFKFEEPVYERRAWYWDRLPSQNYIPASSKWAVKDERQRCPKCGEYLDFYGECDWCLGHGEPEIECPQCDSCDWDDSGVCLCCGYDLVLSTHL